MSHTPAGDAAWRALLSSSSSGSSSFGASGSGSGGGEHGHHHRGGDRERDRDRDDAPASSLQGSVGTSLREAIIRKRMQNDGGNVCRWIVLFAVKEERPFLLKLA
ncbi:hypothetical protein DL93DRAFT_2075804, partial [Clavulina sp. PMI_390]